jgi:hypothetical protein
MEIKPDYYKFEPYLNHVKTIFWKKPVWKFIPTIRCLLIFLLKTKQMNTAELKIKILNQIDSLDSNKIEEFYGVLLNFINSKTEVNEWLEITDQQREGVDAAIEELDSGKGISHQEVMKKLMKKYSPE